jgi:hypothetical protein
LENPDASGWRSPDNNIWVAGKVGKIYVIVGNGIKVAVGSIGPEIVGVRDGVSMIVARGVLVANGVIVAVGVDGGVAVVVAVEVWVAVIDPVAVRVALTIGVSAGVPLTVGVTLWVVVAVTVSVACCKGPSGWETIWMNRNMSGHASAAK